jgi:hypothetical protein
MIRIRIGQSVWPLFVLLRHRAAFVIEGILGTDMMGLSFLNHSPANAEAAQLYRENMKEYVRRVKVSRTGGAMCDLQLHLREKLIDDVCLFLFLFCARCLDRAVTTSTLTMNLPFRIDPIGMSVHHAIMGLDITPRSQATVEESWMDPEDMKSIADGADEDETETDAAGGGGDEGMRAV